MALIEPKMVILKDGRAACIRNQQASDVENVLACVEATFTDDRYFLMTQAEIREFLTVEKNTERMETFNGHDQKLLLVVESEGQIVSVSDVECEEKLRLRHVGQIGMSILPDYRGIGLGMAVMQTMIDWATANSVIEKLALGVWAANERAIGLYRKMGFVEEGRKVREVKYADGTYDDMICMYRFV